jgi:hypothetical protein
VVRAGNEAAHLAEKGWEKTKGAVAAVPETVRDVYTDVKEHVKGEGHDSMDTYRAVRQEKELDRADMREEDMRDQMGHIKPVEVTVTRRDAYEARPITKSDIRPDSPKKTETVHHFYEMVR